MKTMAVIKHLNVMDYITSGVTPVTIKHLGSPFGFQTVKKTLCNSVVPAIALSTHTADHAIGIQESSVIAPRILAAAVRVMNQALSRLPSPISHRQSFHDQRRLHAAIHRPTDNFSR